MTRLSRLAPIALALLAVGSLDACRRKPAAPPPTSTPTTTVDTAAERMRREREAQEAAERARRAREDSLREAAAATAREAATLRSTLEQKVYFEFDQSELSAEGRAALDAKLPILTANPGLSLRIAGHTDERGSAEYNLALGQRRAATVQRYLVERGVDASRLEIVSFGEEQPAAQGANEESWGQNRRAEFSITAGGDMLRRPRE